MDLLTYGMKNRKSSSAVRRCLARAALGVEKARAALEERAIEKSGAELPETDDEKLLCGIRSRIEEEKKARGQQESAGSKNS